jgi:hypothetical protein
VVSSLSVAHVNGREAGQPLLEYFTPGALFDPPCSLFHSGPHRVIELGSGQALPSMHLASHLSPEDVIVLTDLPNVMPLCQQSIRAWPVLAQVRAQALAWGEDTTSLRSLQPTHILLCDLVRTSSVALIPGLFSKSLSASLTHATRTDRV